jgi:hypothetical protein
MFNVLNTFINFYFFINFNPQKIFYFDYYQINQKSH